MNVFVAPVALVLALSFASAGAAERVPSSVAREAKLATGKMVTLTVQFESDNEAALAAFRKAIQAVPVPTKVSAVSSFSGTKPTWKTVLTKSVKAQDPAVDALVADLEKAVADQPGKLSWDVVKLKK